jgi:hypothetical protein
METGKSQKCNIDSLSAFCFECGRQECLSGVKTFDFSPSHARVSPIENRSRRCVHDGEEKNQQFQHDICLLQQEDADLRRTTLRIAAEKRVEKQEIKTLAKRPEEFVAWFA